MSTLKSKDYFERKIAEACAKYGLDAGTLQRYVIHGIQPGDFMFAVLSNDFMGAVGRADSFNKHNLYEWASVIYNDVPSQCHGSRELVTAWIKAGGILGMARSGEAMEQQHEA